MKPAAFTQARDRVPFCCPLARRPATCFRQATLCRHGISASSQKDAFSRKWFTFHKLFLRVSVFPVPVKSPGPSERTDIIALLTGW